MDRAVFKACLREVTGKLPANWKELRRQYEESLRTAPVPDCIGTAKEFIMNTSIQFGLISTTPAIATIPQCKPEPKKSMFKRPANTISEDEVNRAIDWLQEGNNPMCYNNSNTKTEAQTQREYLDKRLNAAAYEKSSEIQKTFRVNNPDNPTTYKELIDAIKNDKFEVVKKVADRVDAYVEEEGRYYGSPFEGIKWKLDNAPDYDGYHDAQDAMEKQKTKAKDAIMSGVYADGLKAIQDFEAWTPVGKSN